MAAGSAAASTVLLTECSVFKLNLIGQRRVFELGGFVLIMSKNKRPDR
jgi:hypothetical protein